KPCKRAGTAGPVRLLFPGPSAPEGPGGLAEPEAHSCHLLGDPQASVRPQGPARGSGDRLRTAWSPEAPPRRTRSSTDVRGGRGRGGTGAGLARYRGRVSSASDPLRDPVFRRLATAYSVNELGNWLGDVALAVVVYDRTRSALATAALFLAARFVPALAAPLAVARLEPA